MDNLLIFGGLLLFIIGVIMLIVAFVKKTKKKKALLLILIGFVVWIVGGAFVDTDISNTTSETQQTDKMVIEDTNSENEGAENLQNPNNVSDENEEENILDNAELLSNNFDEFYENFSKITDVNKNEFLKTSINKKVVWTGKIIDVYDGYAYIQCMERTIENFDPKISVYCNAYVSEQNQETLTSLNREEYVTVTGLFDGIESDGHDEWKVIDAEIVPASN